MRCLRARRPHSDCKAQIRLGSSRHVSARHDTFDVSSAPRRACRAVTLRTKWNLGLSLYMSSSTFTQINFSVVKLHSLAHSRTTAWPYAVSARCVRSVYKQAPVTHWTSRDPVTPNSSERHQPAAVADWTVKRNRWNSGDSKRSGTGASQSKKLWGEHSIVATTLERHGCVKSQEIIITNDPLGLPAQLEYSFRRRHVSTRHVGRVERVETWRAKWNLGLSLREGDLDFLMKKIFFYSFFQHVW